VNGITVLLRRLDLKVRCVYFFDSEYFNVMIVALQPVRHTFGLAFCASRIGWWKAVNGD
jgi:hypothetical protein